MHNAKKVFGGLVALLLLTSAGVTYASTYEWITNFFTSPSTGSVVRSGDIIKVYRDINTSGSYQERRTAYYQATTTPSDFNWTEWTGCRVDSTITGSQTDHCYPLAPSVSATTTLWVRVTTNYAGCGTYTPTPNTMTCGDATTTYMTLIP